MRVVYVIKENIYIAACLLTMIVHLLVVYAWTTRISVQKVMKLGYAQDRLHVDVV